MGSESCHPDISAQRCTLCGACVKVCPPKALSLGVSSVIIRRPEDCDGCSACAEVCPEDAIDCAFEIVWDERTGQ